MRTLHRRLERLSTFGIIKLIIFLPALVTLFVLNEFIDFTAFMISALLEYFRNAIWDARSFTANCHDALKDDVPYKIEAHKYYR